MVLIYLPAGHPKRIQVTKTHVFLMPLAIISHMLTIYMLIFCKLPGYLFSHWCLSLPVLVAPVCELQGQLQRISLLLKFPSISAGRWLGCHCVFYHLYRYLCPIWADYRWILDQRITFLQLFNLSLVRKSYLTEEMKRWRGVNNKTQLFWVRPYFGVQWFLSSCFVKTSAQKNPTFWHFNHFQCFPSLLLLLQLTVTAT